MSDKVEFIVNIVTDGDVPFVHEVHQEWYQEVSDRFFWTINKNLWR